MADESNGSTETTSNAPSEVKAEAKPGPFERLGLAKDHVEEFLAELVERHFSKDVAAFNSAKIEAAASKPKFDAFTGQPLA